MTYDPRIAAKALRAALNTPDKSAPIGPSLAPAYTQSERPATLCILLLAFVAGTAVLPDDFDTVEKTATALKAHVRPDGGVYLGAYQTPNDPAGVVVVFGDPLMESRDVVKATQVFRGRLLAQMDRFDSAKAVGPFAEALAESQLTKTLENCDG